MSSKIERLIERALQAISDDEMMEIARKLINFKDPEMVSEILESRSDTAENREQIAWLRRCFVKILT